MENLVLQRGSNASSNFNNMTDQQLQEWQRALLTEAQRENYINENLEIVRHYRTEALSRAQAFNVERNAIDAAIARHGLYAPNGDPSTVEEDPQPPPIRRARIELPVQENKHTESSTAVIGAGGGGGGGGDHSICSCNCSPYLSLDYLFETYKAPASAGAAGCSSSGGVNTNTNNNNFNHHNNNNNDSNSKNNNECEEAQMNDLAINNSIDSLGLRRT